MRERLRRRRTRAQANTPRGTYCESMLYSGSHFGARCVYRATHYNLFNDVFVCGVHKAGYLSVATIASIIAWNEGSGPDPFIRPSP